MITCVLPGEDRTFSSYVLYTSFPSGFGSDIIFSASNVISSFSFLSTRRKPFQSEYFSNMHAVPVGSFWTITAPSGMMASSTGCWTSGVVCRYFTRSALCPPLCFHACKRDGGRGWFSCLKRSLRSPSRFWLAMYVGESGGAVVSCAPPTTATRVRPWARTWAEIGCSLNMTTRVFLRVLRFSSLLKQPHAKIWAVKRIDHEPLARETGQPLLT